MDSLYSAFDTYLHLVYSKTKGLRTRPHSREGLTVVLNPERELRGIVESLEEGVEFKELVLRTRPAFEELARQTRAAFPDDFYPDMPDSAWSKREAPKIVKNFFRRSGAYSQCIGESSIDVANLFATFESALKQTQMVVRFLAPLESASFSRNLDCGSFSIKRFSRKELDEILQTTVNRIFYTAADTETLCHYWFLVAEERLSVLGSRTTGSYASYSHVFTLREFKETDVSASYQHPPGPIKRALEVMSLLDWEHKTKRWSHFSLPFVILTDDALLRAPHDVPDCSRLEQKRGVHLEETASSQLEKFSRDIDATLVEYPSNHPWHFFEIAITYLVRAFQTEGLDQILWHWVAIEALLGDMPVRETIRKRLGRMLGSTESEQKQIKKHLDKLYDLRCDMVHGKKSLDSLPAENLADTRQIARQAILWFARWLNHVHRNLSGDPSILPSRSQLLSVIDFDKHNRQNIGSLLSSLPPDFPNMSTWSKCNPLPIVKTKKEVV